MPLWARPISYGRFENACEVIGSQKFVPDTHLSFQRDCANRRASRMSTGECILNGTLTCLLVVLRSMLLIVSERTVIYKQHISLKTVVVSVSGQRGLLEMLDPVATVVEGGLVGCGNNTRHVRYIARQKVINFPSMSMFSVSQAVYVLQAFIYCMVFST